MNKAPFFLAKKKKLPLHFLIKKSLVRPMEKPF